MLGRELVNWVSILRDAFFFDFLDFLGTSQPVFVDADLMEFFEIVGWRRWMVDGELGEEERRREGGGTVVGFVVHEYGAHVSCTIHRAP